MTPTLVVKYAVNEFASVLHGLSTQRASKIKS
jgi:hypothetical protein